MRRFTSRALTAIFAVGALSSCATRIPIPYLKPSVSRLPPGALANVYLIVECPTLPGTESYSKNAFQREEDLPVHLNVDRLATSLSKAIAARGGRLAAYSLQSDQVNFYAEALHPSSLLIVRLKNPAIHQDRATEQKEIKRGRSTVKTVVPYWQMSGKMDVEANLVLYPSREPLSSIQKTITTSHRYETEGSDKQRSRMDDMADTLIDQILREPLTTMLPVSVVTRYRTLYVSDDDPSSKEALAAAKRDQWEKAMPVWKARTAAAPTDWKAQWNLGVWAEHRRDFTAARGYYKSAQEISRSSKEAPTAWDALYADLDKPIDLQNNAPDTAQTWFKQRLAVLPFSDVSTSMDGPANVRKLTQSMLTKCGYAPLPLEEVDSVLRDQGFTQGGQLKAATPEQLAAWLKADYLLFGHLENFDEFTLGIIGRKNVSGTFKVWSAEKKDFLWTRDGRVSRTATVSGTKAADVGFGFLQQLVGSWADKASHQPMSEESAYFVADQLSELPRRPIP